MYSRAAEGRDWKGTLRIAVVGVTSAFLIGDTAQGKEGTDNTTAERMLAAAGEAEIDGDSAQCFSLLREAVRVAPEYPQARWQLGQIQVDGKWLAVEEAQRRAAANPRQGEYRELRKAHGESPAGQLALARWCRKNDLAAEARFHWASVLSVEPGNQEALRAVDMRWQNGQLLTRDDIAQQKEQLRDAKRAIKRWSPTIARWRRDVAGNDDAKRDAALNEIRALAALDVIPALEEVTLGRDANQKKPPDECRLISAAFLEALAKMPDQTATKSLLRHAVSSPMSDARASAVEALKPRPQNDFIPALLGALSMPIESSFQVVTNPDGSVHYTHSLYREGAEQDWSFDTRLSAMQHNLGGHWYIHDPKTSAVEIGPPTESEATLAPRKTDVAARYQNYYGSTAAVTERQVWNANQAAERLNAIIISILKAVTGLERGDAPSDWWNWWRKQNEYYAPDDRPIDRRYYSDTDSYYYGYPKYSVRQPRRPPGSSNMSAKVLTGQERYSPPSMSREDHVRLLRSQSCFAKGTLVWTKTGQQPIQTLELGDLVLAQNVNSGELAYKPVIGRTVRPPSEILKLSLGDETLRTTRGHPLWVAGVGWQMAKELGDGAILHGVTGSPRVQSVESDGKEEAYNLVVAEFNTYFVGESGVLVHDNTPRRPTRAIAPGLAAK